MKKIIIDIDNTLWDFASVLYIRMKEINPYVPHPSEWNVFDFWREYVKPRTFYSIIKGIHMEQESFSPYPDAQMFLNSLKEMGLHIIIASHREKDTFLSTKDWLRKFELIYDEIHLSHDKTVLFHDCWMVVDDSPITLETAKRYNIIATGLKMPWNANKYYPLFDSLKDIIGYLKNLHYLP